MKDGPVHPTANRVAQDPLKEGPMKGVDSPREAGVRGEEVEEEIGIVMIVTVKNNRATTAGDRMVTEAAAARNTTGVTATPAQGDATPISFALVKEGRTVALIWREGTTSIIDEVVNRIPMTGNKSYLCLTAAILASWQADRRLFAQRKTITNYGFTKNNGGGGGVFTR